MGQAPRYLLRDRDRIFGGEFVEQVKALGIKQLLSAPRSLWQRAYVERLIGSLRREWLDHMIVFGDRALHPTLTAYASYYHSWRTHLALGKDSPRSRRIQRRRRQHHILSPGPITVVRGNLEFEKYVSNDPIGAFKWPIHPVGFSAPELLELAKLEAWTLKPARLR